MRTVWKFETVVSDEVVVEMPRGAQIIHVAPTVTPAFVQLWAIVDTEEPWEVRRLSIRGTGHELGAVGRHLGTVQSGALVWHLFEAARPPAHETIVP